MQRVALVWICAALLSASAGFLRCAENPQTASNQRWAAILSPSAEDGAVHWRFTTVAPAANWFEVQFVDDAWREGEAGFGSPNPPGGLVATPWSTRDIW